MILALLNNKGGVGKTTSAVSLAAGLAGKKRPVLLMDLDSQGSASLSLGVPRAQLRPSSADVLLDQMAASRAVRKTSVEGLDLLTGSMELANADLVLSDAKGREQRLQEALAPLRERYSFIVLDCPPSLSLLPINALLAADAFMVPVTPHYLALEGLANLMGAVERVHQSFRGGAALMGLLLTMVDYRNRAASEIVQMIRGHYKDLVFQTEIRQNVRLTEAPSFGKTIFEYAKTSPGAQAYRQLADEVQKRCKKGKRHA